VHDNPTRSDVVRNVVPRLLVGAVVVYAFLAGVGLLLTRVFADNAIVRNDRAVSQWFFEHRTTTLTPLSHIGSSMSNTSTAIALTVVLVVGLRLWLRRWRESIAVFVSIAGELFIFVLVTATVHRPRPTVPHLDAAPPTSSFPSGHTGAAVALYVGLAVILLTLSRAEHGHRIGLGGARVLAVLLCLVPLVVAVSRLYRGMHFLTDVIAGGLAGGLWMAVTMRALLVDRTSSAAAVPARAARVAVTD
jgi:membrane-associated phospholipid phosphatase